MPKRFVLRIRGHNHGTRARALLAWSISLYILSIFKKYRAVCQIISFVGYRSCIDYTIISNCYLSFLPFLSNISKKLILRLFNFHSKGKRRYYFYFKELPTIYNFLHKNRKWCCLICYDRFTSKQRPLNHLQKCNSKSIKSYMDPQKRS